MQGKCRVIRCKGRLSTERAEAAVMQHTNCIVPRGRIRNEHSIHRFRDNCFSPM